MCHLVLKKQYSFRYYFYRCLISLPMFHWLLFAKIILFFFTIMSLVIICTYNVFSYTNISLVIICIDNAFSLQIFYKIKQFNFWGLITGITLKTILLFISTETLRDKGNTISRIFWGVSRWMKKLFSYKSSSLSMGMSCLTSALKQVCFHVYK